MGFLESKYLYLGLLILSISYPLFQSFEWRIKLYKNWKPLFISIFFMMLLFIPWDVWFAKENIWWFSSNYTVGIKFLNLPIEEWLFFIIVPYACVFIYEVLNFYVKKDFLISYAGSIFIVSGLLLLILCMFFYDKTYSLVTFFLSGIACFFMAYKKPPWMGRFLLAYLVSLFPFLLINGALTGSFTSSPVVNYNPDEIIGFRILTIPIEDSIYNFLMLLIVISLFEKFRLEKTY